MKGYTWAACSKVIQSQVKTLQTELHHLFGQNLLGISLHGSLALDEMRAPVSNERAETVAAVQVLHQMSTFREEKGAKEAPQRQPWRLQVCTARSLSHPGRPRSRVPGSRCHPQASGWSPGALTRCCTTPMIKNEVCRIFLPCPQIKKEKSTNENATDSLHGSSSGRATE